MNTTLSFDVIVAVTLIAGIIVIAAMTDLTLDGQYAFGR